METGVICVLFDNQPQISLKYEKKKKFLRQTEKVAHRRTGFYLSFREKLRISRLGARYSKFPKNDK